MYRRITELRNKIDKAIEYSIAEYDIPYAVLIGVLEITKHDMLLSMEAATNGENDDEQEEA